MRVAVVGATGLIGRRLTGRLAERGDEVLALSRGGREVPGARAITWDTVSPYPPEAREGVDAIVNLAGEPLIGLWTPAKRRAVRESRVGTTRRVVAAMGDGGPVTLVNASGVDVYGDRGEATLDERSSPGAGLLAEMATEWEGAALEAAGRGVRVVVIRSGIVLAPDGGALPKMALPARLCAGGPLGSGRQWWPWIHVDDEVALIRWALDTAAVSGPVNATSPNPVRQRDFAAALGRALGRPAILPTPAFALRLVLGDGAALVLASKRALPAVAEEGGFAFAHPDLDEALRSALG
jgi:uncharacterized protein (TIGR01777 family)